MSQGELKMSNSILSPTATSFIPGNKLPNYVTSCYPFVTDGQTPVRPGKWQSVARGSGYPGQRMPAPDMYTYSSSGRPGHHYGNMRDPRMHSYNAHPGYNQSQSVTPYSPPMQSNPLSPSFASPVPHHNGYYPTSPTAMTPTAMTPTPAWMQAGRFQEYNHRYPPPAHAPLQMNHRQPYPGQVMYYKNNESTESWPNAATEVIKTPVTKKTKEHEVGTMVSVGIQNESGTRSSTSRKPKTKTIILMDAAMQTDFSDEIANLTLAEKPNALYKKSGKRSRRRTAAVHQGSMSTDSEEVDSDSGYSSPLHRRNQASNGTHPVVVSGLLSSENQLNMHRYGTQYTFPTQGYTGYTLNNPVFVSVSNLESSYDSMPCSLSQGYATMAPSSSGHEPLSSVSSTQSTHINLATIKPVKEQFSENAANVDEEAIASSGGKRKRKRNRRRRRKTVGSDIDALSDGPLGLERALSSSNISHASSDHRDESGLHFEDEEEYPDLLASNSASGQDLQSNRHLSYSDILKSQAPTSPMLSQENQFRNQPMSPKSSCSEKNTHGGKDKASRRRRKRQDQANKAAEEELAEISIEQQMLKEMGVHKQQNQTSGKKSKQPVTLNIAAMIDALEKQQEEQQQKEKENQINKSKPRSNSLGALGTISLNPLDSSAPSIKRGKEREAPKAKKPSSLKKVILKEREQKKKLRLLGDDDDLLDDDDDLKNNDESVMPFATNIIENSDLSQDAMSSKASGASSMDMGTVSADLSPISQTSPISMSPLSPGGSPLNSGVNSPIAGMAFKQAEVTIKIHSRRFREYCNQILDKDIDNCCTLLLQELVRFQDRLFNKDPVKAKIKRRIVLGLREVTKHLKLRKIKCVIISPNLERIQSKGGLDEALNNIIHLCAEQGIPFVFALGRRALGRACAKLVPVSVAGIFNYDGAEEHFNKLMELTVKATTAYDDMIAILEKEAQENNYHGPVTGSMVLAHMGHSRTPSACSAISFTSSILSEPISENYPHSEPETDSRGYEVIRNKIDLLNAELNLQQITSVPVEQTQSVPSPRESADSDISLDSRENSPDKKGVNDIDDGHEADTEDINDVTVDRTKEKTDIQNNITKFIETDTQELHHIDSIHAPGLDLTADILSQHPSRTLDLDVVSTHSSKTLEVNALAEKTVSQTLDGIVSDVAELCLGNTQKLKVVNKERIESWVESTTSAMED